MMFRKRAIPCVSVLSLLTFAIILSLRLLTDGSLPSSEIAMAIRDDVVTWASRTVSSAEKASLPNAVKRLRPLSVEMVDGGVLIIFQRRFVEDRGYYYAINITRPPEEIEVFCMSIGNNVYSYYNPG